MNDVSEEDLLLIILVALAGYEIENDEPFTVDKNILADIYKVGIEKGYMPVLSLEHTDDNRLKLQVEMSEVSE